jgi:hypothetical protein
MSTIYEGIGRLVVGFVWRRYRREIQAAGAVGLGVAALAVAAWLAGRDSDEDIDT